MNKTWLALGVLNTFFITLIASMLIIPLFLLKQLEFDKRELGYTITKAWRFTTVDDTWFHNQVMLKLKIAGFASGNFIVISGTLPAEREETVIKHEEAHVLQAYEYGILQPIAYGGHSLYIAITARDFSKHAYYDNFFERQAREYAGQDVDKPREDWGNPDNRFFW